MERPIKTQPFVALLATLLGFTATAQVAPSTDANAPGMTGSTSTPVWMWPNLPRVPYAPPTMNAAVRLNHALGIANMTAIPITALPTNAPMVVIQNGVSDSASSPNGALIITQQTKGRSAAATFSFLSEDGCLWTDVVIQGGAGSILDPFSKRTPTQSAFVSVSMYDMCLGVLTHFIWGELFEDVHFEMEPNLGWAKLVAVIPVCDNVTTACFDMYVECEWAISGSHTNEVTNLAQHVPGYLLTIHASGKQADATAKAGVYPLITDTWNLTPNLSDSARMNDNTDRYHYVGRAESASDQ